MQDPHTSQDTTRLCLQYPHRAWSLVRDATTQDPHTFQDTAPLCLQDPHRAWSLVRDTTRRTHTPLMIRTPHDSAYKTRTEHGRWLETPHAGPTHLSGHHTSLPTIPAQSMVAGQRRHHAGPTHLSGHRTSLPTRPAQSMVAG